MKYKKVSECYVEFSKKKKLSNLCLIKKTREINVELLYVLAFTIL